MIQQNVKHSLFGSMLTETVSILIMSIGSCLFQQISVLHCQMTLYLQMALHLQINWAKYSKHFREDVSSTKSQKWKWIELQQT